MKNQLSQSNSNAGTQAVLAWQSDLGPNAGSWDASREVTIPITGNDMWYTYTVDLSANANWFGHHITAIRLEPTDGVAANVELDQLWGPEVGAFSQPQTVIAPPALLLGINPDVALFLEQANTDAFGLDWNRIFQANADDEPHGYTGQERLDLDVLFCGARLYMPELGRFLQVDPAREFHNPYSYVGNKSILAVDPNGEMEIIKGNAFGMGEYYSITFQKTEKEHLAASKAADWVKFVAPGPGGKLKWIVDTVEISSSAFTGKKFLDYSMVKHYDEKGALDSYAKRAKFEEKVANFWLSLSKANGRPKKHNGGIGYVLEPNEVGILASAFLGVLLEMEVNGDLPEYGAVLIFEGFGFKNMIEEAKDADKLENDIIDHVSENAKGKSKDWIIKKVGGILK